jgi:O-acetyl-ADP-ribose deacetylase (regulator of RNase III)
MKIHYLKGDATVPQAKGKKVIAHICNDLGGWGKGFVLAISKRWREPELEYRNWHKGRDGFELGAVQFVEVEPTICIANMIGQHGMKNGSKGPPIRYKAVESCLQKVADRAIKLSESVHMPRIGCGLAGGKWDEIESIIERTLLAKEIEVYVYDYDGK